FLAAVLAVDGSHGMDHVTRGEAPARGHDGLARGQPLRILLLADDAACSENLRPSGTMDRTIHSAATHEARVGRVDDGIDLFAGDIADFDEDSGQGRSEGEG